MLTKLISNNINGEYDNTDSNDSSEQNDLYPKDEINYLSDEEDIINVNLDNTFEMLLP